jgi:hypothetical protein
MDVTSTEAGFFLAAGFIAFSTMLFAVHAHRAAAQSRAVA